MAGHYFLILDNGGTNTRALLFDEEGTQIGVSVFDTPWIQDKPEMREIDLKGMRDSLFAAIRQVLSQTGISPAQIACITCVGHGKGIYLLGRNGEIFCNGILSTDERANDMARSFSRPGSRRFIRSAISMSWPARRRSCCVGSRTTNQNVTPASATCFRQRISCVTC